MSLRDERWQKMQDPRWVRARQSQESWKEANRDYYLAQKRRLCYVKLPGQYQFYYPGTGIKQLPGYPGTRVPIGRSNLAAAIGKEVQLEKSLQFLKKRHVSSLF